MKQLFLVIVLAIVIGLSASAQTLDWDTAWTSYQNGEGSTGYETGQPESDFVGVDTTALITTGSQYPLLHANLDSDLEELSETVLVADSYVYIIPYDFDVGDATSINTLSTIQTAPAIQLGVPYSRINFISNNRWGIIEYNSTTSNYEERYYTDATLSSCTEWDGIKCDETNIGFDSGLCHAVCHNGTNSRLVTFEHVDNTLTVHSPMATTMGLTGTSIGALGNIDNAGAQEYVFICDSDNDTRFGVCVVDVSNGQLYTSFSGDGIIDDLTGLLGGNNEIANPVISNLNNIGNAEIILGYSVVGACNIVAGYNINAYTASGAIFWTRATATTDPVSSLFHCVNSPTATYYGHSQEFIAHANGTKLVCGTRLGTTAGGGFSAVAGCLNGLTGATFANVTITGYEARLQAQGKQSGVAIKDTSDTLTTDFMVGQYYFNITGSTISYDNMFTPYVDTSYMFSVQDINNDGTVELFATSNSHNSGQTFAFYTGGTAGEGNTPPELLGLLYGGYTGWYEGAVCRGTTVTFKADECDDGDDDAQCNYVNDFSTDSERLRTDCGTGTATLGSLSDDTPEVACTYNATGSFLARIYLHDQLSGTDFTQYNTQDIIVNVIDGSPGVTCNIGASLIGTTTNSSSTIATDDSIEEGFTSLWSFMFDFGSVGAKARIFVAFGLIALLIYGGVRIAPQNPALPIVMFVLGMVGTWGIGLLSGWILLLTLLAGALIYTLVKTAFTPFPSGGG